MRNSEYSSIYIVSPPVVKPKPNTSDCSPLPKRCRLTSHKVPTLLDDKVLVLENRKILQWSDHEEDVNSASKENYIDDSRIKHADGCHRSCERLSQSTTSESKQVHPPRTDSRAKLCSDASTHTNIPPEVETVNAYFAEHPVLDFIGSSCGVVTLIVMLWYVLEFYVHLIEFCHK